MRYNAFLLCLVSIIAVGALSGSASAQDSFSPFLMQAFFATPGFAALVGIAVVALTVNICVVAIGYIVGKIVPASGINSWISNEYWEIAKSALIIAAIFGILVFLGNVALDISGTCGTPSGNPFGTLFGCAQSFLAGAQTGTLIPAINSALDLAGSIGFLQQATISYQLALPPVPIPPFTYPVFTWGFSNLALYPPAQNMLYSNPFTSIGTYESIVNDEINFLLLPMSMVLFGQSILLDSFYVLGLYVLLPMGIILRAFPFIRGIGGTLIAIGIGVGLLYPATLVLVNQPILSIITTSAPVGTPPCTSGTIICGVVQFLSGANSFSSFGVALGSVGELYPAFNYLLSYSAWLILYFILFILDVVMIYPLVDFTAKLLGNPAGVKLSIGGKFKLA